MSSHKLIFPWSLSSPWSAHTNHTYLVPGATLVQTAMGWNIRIVYTVRSVANAHHIQERYSYRGTIDNTSANVLIPSIPWWGTTKPLRHCFRFDKVPGLTLLVPHYCFVCVFFTLNRSFYPSASSTTSVRADSSILEEIQVMWSQGYATEIATYAISTAVGNAMPCHHTGYDRQHDIHILWNRETQGNNKKHENTAVHCTCT